MRSIGLDIHRDFCEVAIAEGGGEIRSAGRIEMTPAALELFAQSLGRDDRVALEVSGNAWEVARIIRPTSARWWSSPPADTGIRQARAKTDRLDARALAKLLGAARSTRSAKPSFSDLFGLKGRRRGALLGDVLAYGRFLALDGEQ